MFKGKLLQKEGKSDLQFIYSARRLITLYVFVKFRENTNGICVVARTRNFEALKNGRTDTKNFGGHNIIPANFVSGILFFFSKHCGMFREE